MGLKLSLINLKWFDINNIQMSQNINLSLIIVFYNVNFNDPGVFF